jgi:hypothetical protein
MSGPGRLPIQPACDSAGHKQNDDGAKEYDRCLASEIQTPDSVPAYLEVQLPNLRLQLVICRLFLKLQLHGS